VLRCLFRWISLFVQVEILGENITISGPQMGTLKRSPPESSPPSAATPGNVLGNGAPDGRNAPVNATAGTPNAVAPKSSNGGSSSNRAAILGGAVGGGVLLVFAVLALLLWRRRGKRPRYGSGPAAYAKGAQRSSGSHSSAPPDGGPGYAPMTYSNAAPPMKAHSGSINVAAPPAGTALGAYPQAAPPDAHRGWAGGPPPPPQPGSAPLHARAPHGDGSGAHFASRAATGPFQQPDDRGVVGAPPRSNPSSANGGSAQGGPGAASGQLAAAPTVQVQLLRKCSEHWMSVRVQLHW
jgi:hypothetical protein